MNSPLARHLARFTSEPMMAVLVPAPDTGVPHVTLTLAEMEERLEGERERARAEALAVFERRLENVKAEGEGAIERALAAARATWVAEGAASLSASCDAAMTDLRELMCARLADVVRPLLAETLIRRAVAGLSDAMERLIADPAHPLIKLRGPADLIDTLKGARGDLGGIDYEVCDAVDVTMTAEGSHVETQIAVALSALFSEALS